jgi:hypothetical protein
MLSLKPIAAAGTAAVSGHELRWWVTSHCILVCVGDTDLGGIFVLPCLVLHCTEWTLR